jgi:alpha-tubulin suppressor-like RCC1 family protein
MWGAAGPHFHDLQKTQQLRPVLFPSPSPTSPIASVSIGDHHYAVVTRDGAVYTAGSGQYHELGHGGGASQPLRRVPSLPPCVAVQCGEWQTVALTAAGEVFSWGWAGSFISPNALGHGDKRPCPQPRRVEALQGRRVQSIAAGKQHVLALTEEGEVWAWGRGEFGRLGLGGSGNQLLPQRIDALTGAGLEVAGVVCGSSFSAAVLRDGQLYTWGRNDFGQRQTAAEQT